MNKVQIKKDRYSLYFKIGKDVYRPVQTQETMDKFGHILPFITLTRFREGRYVIVRQLSDGVASARIEGATNKEKWFLHGQGRSSEQWKPDPRELGS